VVRALAEALAAERLGIVAALIRTTGDWDLAEDAVADAAERALRRWPADGVPDKPAAWLTTTARRRAIDLIRRAATERAKLTEIALTEELRDDSRTDATMTFSNDDRLRLIFTCAHPALAMEARVALTLKVVAGLSTEAVAQAFLTTEATMSPAAAPRQAQDRPRRHPLPGAAGRRPARSAGRSAGDVYLVFTSGYARFSGDLAEEAIRLGGCWGR
jgi:RNA polymerase sigma-70 factor (ECF subfamily)